MTATQLEVISQFMGDNERDGEITLLELECDARMSSSPKSETRTLPHALFLLSLPECILH
jgi:hypothetical protein